MLTFLFPGSSSARLALVCSLHPPAAVVAVDGPKRRRQRPTPTVQKAVDREKGCLRDRSTLRINRAWSAPTCVLPVSTSRSRDESASRSPFASNTLAYYKLHLAGREAPTPVGRGNAATLDAAGLLLFAQEVAVYLRDVERHFAVRIQRTGIDAPSRARSNEIKRRRAEGALDSQASTMRSDLYEKVHELTALRKRAGEVTLRIRVIVLPRFIGFGLGPP
jgi:hypothetical protein